MIRQPIATRNQQRQQISRVVSRAAPVNGWNARDALASMKPGDAITLKNWWPTSTDCVIRGGMADYASGTTGDVETLAVYNAANGNSKMFAATDNGVYDVSSAGAVGASVATSTDGYWQYINFGDGTNNWLILVNGQNKPNYYNGTAWTAVDGGTTPALTGLTTTSIIHVFSHMKRLFFIEKDSLSFWYLAAGAAGGALAEFDLSSIAKKGGYLMAGGAWSVADGDNQNDLAVFVTSQGEVIVYRGTNPGDAAAWEKVAHYFLGRPQGRRCLMKIGGDLNIITENGVFPLSALFNAKEIDGRLAITNKIEKAFAEASLTYGSNVGWEGIYYPAQSAAIFNIPVEASISKQYAQNTGSPRKPWCEFDSWNAKCFAVYAGSLYYGVGTEVKKAWTGTSDDGLNIVAVAKEAFSNYGSGDQKELMLFRPILQVNGSISFLTGMDVDFRETNIAGEATYVVTSGAQWNVGDWDEVFWAANLDIVRRWRSPQESIGTWFAGKVKITTNMLEVHWIASDAMFVLGADI